VYFKFLGGYNILSRIGKHPIVLSSEIEAIFSGKKLEIIGPKGKRSLSVNKNVRIEISKNFISVSPVGKSKKHHQQWGMTRTIISNLVKGVSHGFEKVLEIRGVGYRAQMQGQFLKLDLGFSHDINYLPPKGITISTVKQTEITISGIDLQLVGQVAADIRKWRKPEPYKGKGIRYKNEYILLKEGKKK